MSRSLTALGLAIVLTCVAVLRAADPSEDLARAIVSELAAESFDTVAARFTPSMTASFPVATLAASWRRVTGQIGAFRSVTAVTTDVVNTFQRVVLTCAFDRTHALVTLVFDADGHVAGLTIAPMPRATTPPPATAPDATSGPAWTPPPYATPATFEERDVVVGDRFTLPGTLSMPRRDTPVPGLVLVGGSGPNDRDESLLGNKPMKDLAFGLASRGIAVLRYDKRSLRYPALFQPSVLYTVREEAMDDARAAVTLLAATPGVDAKRIFILGHSLGGMLAPRIATEDRRVAGLVIMAGPTRPTEDLVLEQVRYLEKDNATAIAAAEAFVRQVQDPQLNANTVVDMLGGKTPGSYWLDLRGYRPADLAATLDIPILALQGERDYQTTLADFAGWKQALTGRAAATLKSYPALNHLFLEGTGPSLPEEYRTPRHVPAVVIDDIAAWVKARSPRD